MARSSKRDVLLTTAAAIVLRDGANALTLDAVARESGVSKGGLLYHFGTKESLVRGLVAAIVDSFEAALSARADDRPGAFARSYLLATAEGEQASLPVSAGLLAAVAIAPECLAPLQDSYRRWTERLRSDGLDEADAVIVRLAADGLWMADLLGLDPPTGAQRAAVVARLVALTEVTASR